MSNQITKSIIVSEDPASLYATWLNFENHPKFMDHIKSVTSKGPDTNHWVMEGPLNTTLEWTTKTTRLEPNRRIAWKTIDGDLKTSGQVTFTSLPQNQTEITVTSQTTPPKDLMERTAFLFENEEKQWEENLRRFKAIMEERSV